MHDLLMCGSRHPPHCNYLTRACRVVALLVHWHLHGNSNLGVQHIVLQNKTQHEQCMVHIQIDAVHFKTHQCAFYRALSLSITKPVNLATARFAGRIS